MDAAVLSVQIWLNKTYKGKAGYKPIAEDGITGWGTVKALTVALQIEEGIASPNGNFGPSTRRLCPTLSVNSGTSNFVNILKGGLYCKGYEGGALDGKFTDRVKGSVMEFQSDAGLANPDGVVNAVIFKALLTMDAFKLLNYGPYKGNLQIRAIQQDLNRNYIANKYFSIDIGLVPCDGIYGRSTNKALLYALQIEEGISVPNGVFGPSTRRLCPVLREGSSKTTFVKLLEYALYLNNYNPNNFSGVFTSDVKRAVIGFQKFSALDADGIAGLSTWASLLVSSGNTNRKGNACDCAQTITEARAKTLKKNGYKYIGRYLTGKFKMTNEEVQTILNNGFKLFPIFEVGGYRNEYFTEKQGIEDAKSAMKAANDLGFSEYTIIYFAVDYDAVEYQIKSNVLPYFKGIYDTLQPYNVGIYGPRHVCSLVAQNGYSCSSFVCDMSTGFSGNLGYSLPNDWAFDQISTITLGSGDGKIEIDNNIASNRYGGENNLNKNNSHPSSNPSLDDKYKLGYYNRNLVWDYSTNHKYTSDDYSDSHNHTPDGNPANNKENKGHRKFNPEYFRYDIWYKIIYGILHGSDCANFVSQCIYSGGVVQTDDFNFSWKESRPFASTAWINVSALKDYLISKGYAEELIFFNSIEDLKNNYDKYGIKCGDVAFLAYNENGENKGTHGAVKATLESVNAACPSSNFHHAMIVTEVTNGNLRISSHSNDHINVNVEKDFFVIDPPDDGHKNNYFVVLKMKDK